MAQAAKKEPTLDELRKFAELVANFKTPEELGEEFDPEEQAGFFEEVIASARQVLGREEKAA